MLHLMPVLAMLSNVYNNPRNAKQLNRLKTDIDNYHLDYAYFTSFLLVYVSDYHPHDMSNKCLSYQIQYILHRHHVPLLPKKYVQKLNN